MTRLEHFQELIKQSCRGYVLEKPQILGHRLANALVNLEIEFGRKTCSPEHSNRVLSQSFIGVADQHQAAALNVLHSIDVVPDTEIGDVVIQRITGEIAPPDILADAAIDIVAQDSPRVVVCDIRMLFIALGSGTESGHFDDFPAEADMRQPEPASDQPAVGKQGPHFFGMCVGRNIEILGMQLKQRIPYAAAHEKCLKPGFVQPVQYLERTF